MFLSGADTPVRACGRRNRGFSTGTVGQGHRVQGPGRPVGPPNLGLFPRDDHCILTLARTIARLEGRLTVPPVHRRGDRVPQSRPELVAV